MVVDLQPFITPVLVMHMNACWHVCFSAWMLFVLCFEVFFRSLERELILVGGNLIVIGRHV